MPPKAKVTREEIIEAAFTVVRESGVGLLNARQVALKLGCSTQPVMYHFKTMEDLKTAVYASADRFHTEYLMRNKGQGTHPFLEIGLNYIRFAQNEAPLFRFLFQSGFSPHQSLQEMIESDELLPVLSVLQKEAKLNLEQSKNVFVTLALFAHGYASLLSNQHLEYDEALITSQLAQVYKGAILAAQEKKHENAVPEK